MKKLLVILFILFSISSYSADINISMGVSKVHLNNNGIDYNCGTYGMTIGHVYFDVVSNFVGDRGQLPESTVMIRGFNVGFEEAFYDSKRLFFIPVIGYYSAHIIYPDENGYNKNTYQDLSEEINLGIGVKYYLTNKFGVYVGIGSVEKYKFSVFLKMN